MGLNSLFILKFLLLIPTLVLQSCVMEDLSRPNFLLITADNMSYDSPGFAGGVAPDVTPNIDRLAGESFSFESAFSLVSVCQSSRQSMLSGLYPHNYGSAGFFPMKDGVPALPSLLGAVGYFTGNINKTDHMLPDMFYLLRAKELYDWSMDPGSAHNLAQDTEYSGVLSGARKGLLQWMKSSNDPLAGECLNFINLL